MIDRGAPDPRIGMAARWLAADRPVDDVAGRLGISNRQLHRLSLSAFGYGPKMLARILRLRRARSIAHQGYSSAEVASLAGYADQAHLIRDAVRLTGQAFEPLRY